MAGDWLKMEASTPDKPEVLAITASMGWDDPDLTVGKLFRVWRWFDQQTTNGNAFGVTATLLDRIVGVSGFANAMQKVGWLVVSDSGLELPNFDKHNGATAKSRSETAKRVANHRARKGDEDTPGEYQRLTIPRPIRAAVLARDGNACVYCSRKQGEYAPTETARDGYLHIDHVIPLTNGGTDDISNLATACAVCNMFKSDRTPEECGLDWPEHNGKRLGNRKTVTPALAREEKRREEKKEETQPSVVGAERASPSKGSRLPADWFIPEEWHIWATSEFPQWPMGHVNTVACDFADYWHAKAGKDAIKTDWFATWRRWCRKAQENVRAPPMSFRERDSAHAAARVHEMTGGLVSARTPRPDALQEVFDAIPLKLAR